MTDKAHGIEEVPADLPGEQPEGRPAAQDKVVPVAESIRYRRRAQQAEKRAEQLEQQLRETQAQFEQRLEQLAAAEAQRDEIADRLVRVEQRHRLEQTLTGFGVQDIEAAMLLLEKDGSLSPEADEPAVTAAVEKLLLNRPHLCARRAGMPAQTASPRQRLAPQASLIRTAERAARSGDRRDIAQYLRLRRQASKP